MWSLVRKGVSRGIMGRNQELRNREDLDPYNRLLTPVEHHGLASARNRCGPKALGVVLETHEVRTSAFRCAHALFEENELL